MIDSRYCTPFDVVIHGLYKECSTLSFSVVPSNGFETIANKDFPPQERGINPYKRQTNPYPPE
jgi:hypothetical protein